MKFFALKQDAVANTHTHTHVYMHCMCRKKAFDSFVNAHPAGLASPKAIDMSFNANRIKKMSEFYARKFTGNQPNSSKFVPFQPFEIKLTTPTKSIKFEFA